MEASQRRLLLHPEDFHGLQVGFKFFRHFSVHLIRFENPGIGVSFVVSL